MYCVASHECFKEVVFRTSCISIFFRVYCLKNLLRNAQQAYLTNDWPTKWQKTWPTDWTIVRPELWPGPLFDRSTDWVTDLVLFLISNKGNMSRQENENWISLHHHGNADLPLYYYELSWQSNTSMFCYKSRSSQRDGNTYVRVTSVSVYTS